MSKRRGRKSIACWRGMHFRGACDEWVQGANKKYARRGDEKWLLRPDCMPNFMRAVHYGPVRHWVLEPFAEYAAHMAQAARTVIPGAGVHRASLAQHFITSFVRPRRWVAIRCAAEEFRPYWPVTVHGAMTPQASDALLRQAVATLTRRGKLCKSSDRRAVHYQTQAQLLLLTFVPAASSSAEHALSLQSRAQGKENLWRRI